jgi:hypothetical protein
LTIGAFGNGACATAAFLGDPFALDTFATGASSGGALATDAFAGAASATDAFAYDFSGDPFSIDALGGASADPVTRRSDLCCDAQIMIILERCKWNLCGAT